MSELPIRKVEVESAVAPVPFADLRSFHLLLELLEAVEECDHSGVEFRVPKKPEADGSVKRKDFVLHSVFDVGLTAERHQFVAMERKAHFPGQGGEQDRYLTPGRVNFRPVDRNRRQSAQSQSIDGAKVANMPQMKRGVESVCLFQAI